MRILISGASGLIGRALTAHLSGSGTEVVRLVRRPAQAPREVFWDPTARSLDASAIEGLDGVVHLAGENLAARRWSGPVKARIRDSRIAGTRLLSETLAGLDRPPRVLVSASGIGIYGDRGDERLTEESPAGRGFLAELARAWEGATEPARARGIRVVAVRTGIVLSPAGGALGRMLPPFRFGLGGPIADGRAWWSWIALDDLVAIYQFALDRGDVDGPLNAVSPHPVRNLQLARTLGRVLGRPVWLPVPVLALRLAFGELADQALLASVRVEPARLERAGYRFRFPELEPALRHMLGRAAGPGAEAMATRLTR